jgi:hypothetical protein
VGTEDSTETVLSFSLVTYRLPLAESKAIANGAEPTVIGIPITVFV